MYDGWQEGLGCGRHWGSSMVMRNEYISNEIPQYQKTSHFFPNGGYFLVFGGLDLRDERFSQISPNISWSPRSREKYTQLYFPIGQHPGRGYKKPPFNEIGRILLLYAELSGISPSIFLLFLPSDDCRLRIRCWESLKLSSERKKNELQTKQLADCCNFEWCAIRKWNTEYCSHERRLQLCLGCFVWTIRLSDQNHGKLRNSLRFDKVNGSHLEHHDTFIAFMNFVVSSLSPQPRGMSSALKTKLFKYCRKRVSLSHF